VKNKHGSLLSWIRFVDTLFDLKDKKDKLMQEACQGKIRLSVFFFGKLFVYVKRLS